MKEKSKLIFIIIAALVLIAGGIGAYYYFKDDKKEEEEKIVITEDEKKFKEEYESLNGEKNSNGVSYTKVELPDDNNYKYMTEKEAVDFLKNGTGVLYMGFKTCPWCRNLVPILSKAATNVGVKEINYLDILDIRSSITLNAKNKAEVTKKGTDAYYELMNILDDYLEDFVLTTSKGKKVSTGEKRIYAPTLVVVKDGVVVGFHVGTVDGHDKIDGVLPDITKEQTDELYVILEELLSKVSDSNCDENC